MKKLFTLLLLLITSAAFAQSTLFSKIKVHSHNDYTRNKPLIDAYNEGVDQIEADVFLLGDSLVVAHHRKDINPDNSLNKLYLKPIDDWFKKWNKRVSPDRLYTFSLMIDVKEDWYRVYQALQREIEKYGDTFDRSKSMWAIQIVISGERPPVNMFSSYPDWLFFDGLPDTDYYRESLKKVVLISDDFSKYSQWNGVGEMPEADKEKLKAVVKQARALKKPIRFWGAPDTNECWFQLYKLGVNMINTDRIFDCKRYLATIVK